MPYLSTERARRDAVPADEGERPLALARRVGASQVVEQVCSRARAAGLRPGWSLGQAQAIVPSLLVLPHEPRRDREVLERLARWAMRFSPVVEPVEPDTLLVDITGCQLLFGGEENIARQSAQGLAAQGFRARGAVSDTVGAAYALAAAGPEPLVIAPAGQTSAWLAPLPPRALRIAPQVSEQLEALGVRSIGDLLMLPRSSLPARFGSHLVRRLQQALGEVFEGVTPLQPEETPRAQWPFEVAVADFGAVFAAAECLLEEVFAQLGRRELALRRLECVLHYEDAGPVVVAVSLSRASRQRRHVAELLRQRLERLDLSPRVVGLTLVARETSRFRGGQGELFEPREAGDDEVLGCLIDRLAGRLGSEAVVRPELLDDHQPERAYRYVSVAEVGCEPGGAGSGPDLAVDASLARHGVGNSRPVRLLSEPVPIRAIALVPDGPPTWFSYRGREHVVAQAAGPERLETAWWRGPDVRRDYFRVTAESGEQFWIFRAVGGGGWYWHGVFA